MTVNVNAKTWVIGTDITVSAGRGYSDPDNVIPGTPAIITSTVDSSTVRVTLVTASTYASTYTLRYRIGEGSYTTVTGITPGQFPYDVTPLASGTLFGFSVAGVNSAGTGAYSSESSANTAGSGAAVAHGATITITGTGFGTRNNVKPVYMTLGASKTPSALGRITSGGWSASATTTAGTSLGSSGGSVVYDLAPGSGSAFGDIELPNGLPGVVYVERYYDFDITDSNNWDTSGGGFNLKTNRFWQVTTNNPKGNVYVGYQGSEGASTVRMFMENVDNNVSNYYGVGVPASQWLSEEFLLKSSSSPGTRDGELRHIRNASWLNSANKYLITTRDSAIQVDDPTQVFLDQVSNNNRAGPFNCYYNYLLIDDEWLGVYVGNAPTVGSCTRLVRQPQAAWSSTSITFEGVETGVVLDGSWAYIRTGIDSWASADGIPSSEWSVA